MLEDLLAENLRLVVCGSAAGQVSAELRQYYAGPGNRFWSILAETGIVPEVIRPSQYSTLLRFGVGLTDMVKDQSGSDASIDFSRSSPDGLRDKLERLQPTVLCFNGKRAAQAYFNTNRLGYGEQADRILATRLFIAPSTSGAARRWWDPAPWHHLAELVGPHSP